LLPVDGELEFVDAVERSVCVGLMFALFHELDLHCEDADPGKD
jgi:hypothetical protein